MENFKSHIEYTSLKKDLKENDIQNICDIADIEKYFGICLFSQYLTLAKQILKNSEIKLISVVDFPLGQGNMDLKQRETEQCLLLGADEVDMVMNYQGLKAKNYSLVEEEIRSVAKICHEANKFLKIIIESGELNEENTVLAAKIVEDAGAHYVKTSTGCTFIGAELSKIRLIKENIEQYQN